MGRSSTAAQPRTRDAETKLAQGRLSVLELAKELGNVAEACRQRGLDRTSFYEWKRRFQTQEGPAASTGATRRRRPSRWWSGSGRWRSSTRPTAATAMSRPWRWRACGCRVGAEGVNHRVQIDLAHALQAAHEKGVR